METFAKFGLTVMIRICVSAGHGCPKNKSTALSEWQEPSIDKSIRIFKTCWKLPVYAFAADK
jgi:hypothetical protein